MTVGDLITKLQTYDPNMHVALSDWSEQRLEPSVIAAEDVGLGSALHSRNPKTRKVKHVFAVIIGRV